MAEQEEPVRRRVALKIIKAGMDTQEGVARFEAERQALALMDHPNIARVFEVGATEMAGRTSRWNWCGACRSPISATDRRLDLSERLEAVHAGLPGGATRAPERSHSP